MDNITNISGNWLFSVNIPSLGSGNPQVVMQQDADNKLSGTFSGQITDGPVPITGTYDGVEFEFSFDSSFFDLGVITYRGALKDDGTVSGAIITSHYNNGTFTGQRTQ